MAEKKIAVKIIPTPATQDIAEKDLLRLARITKLTVEIIRERLSKGKGITIVTPEHPRVADLAKMIKSLGFSVSTGIVAEKADSRPSRKVERVSSGVKHPPKRSQHEWKVGELIDNLYEVLDIKQGGMGSVYIVRHLRWNASIAVKTLLDRLRESEEDQALFLKEAETWIDIGFHPNIAACYYVRNIEGSPRIFIEYVDGGSLSQWIYRRRQAGWDLILDLMAQVGDGLEHAHSKGLVHRDIKPANCMLTKDLVVKVTDFGLTKRRVTDSNTKGQPDFTTTDITIGRVIKDREDVTAAGMGTPGFMAPEMWIPNAEVGPAADIYAFGIMFFEICCGRKPFVVVRGERRDKLARAHMKKRPPRPTSLRKDMPQCIEDIILRCLRKRPSDRYASFADVRKDVEAAYEEIFKRTFPRQRPDEVRLLSDALNNRAVSLMDLKHFDEAQAALESALRSDPQHPEAVYNLGLLEWQLSGNPDRELVVKLEEVVTTPEYRGRGAHLLGRCLLVLGDAEEAVKACEAALTAEDASEEWLKTSAIALIGAGRDKEAIGRLQSYLEAFPADDDTRGWLIGAMVRCDEMKQALAMVQNLPEGSTLVGMGPKEIAKRYLFAGRAEKLRLEGHRGWITCIVHCPKTRSLVSGARDRTVKIWDHRTGEEIRNYAVVGQPPSSLCVSPDESLMAITEAKTGNPVKILDLQSGRFAGNLLAHDRITAVGFSPDSTHVVTVEEKGVVRLWQTDGFKASATYKIPAHTAADLLFDRKTRPYVVLAGRDRIVRRIRLEDSETLTYERIHDELITGLKTRPDGTRLLTCGRDRQSVVWDARNGTKIAAFSLDHDQINDIALNPSLNLAASYGTKSGIKLWDTTNGLVLRTFEPENSEILCIAFSPDGERLAAGGREMTVKVWDVRGRSIPPELALTKVRPVTKQMQSDQEFKTIMENARKAMRIGAYAKVYSLVRKAQTLPGYERSDLALETILQIKDHGLRVGLRGGWNRKTIDTSNGVMDVRFSPSAINFLTAQADHTVRMWSTKTSDCLKVLKGHTNLVSCLAFSFNGREAVSAGDDRTVRTWDLNTGKNLALFKGHTDSVSSVAYSRNGRTVLSGSWDSTVKLWSLTDGSLMRNLKGHEDKVGTVAIMDDVDLILSGGFDGVVRIWEMESGKVIKSVKGHRDKVTSLTVAPGRDQFATGSLDGMVRIWDVKTGMTRKDFEVDESGVRTVAFSPDQNFMVTGGNDSVLRVWSVESGECLREFRGHSREITAAEFSSNGRLVISSSVDGTVMIWEVDWDWEFEDKEPTQGVWEER